MRQNQNHYSYLLLYLFTLFVLFVLLTYEDLLAATPQRLVYTQRTLQQLWPQERKKITVAVIDTGIDTEHNQLKSFLWQNPGEMGWDEEGQLKQHNQKDDDGNGYVDDVNGWNFIDQDSNVSDTHGHGTHVAGIIVNKKKWSTQAIPIELMVLKYYGENLTPEQNVLNTVKAINYAIAMGAQVINYSSGGGTPSLAEKEAIKRASAKNILFVTAAGNFGLNTDRTHFYPASYGLSNVISVAASDRQKRMMASSNYGAHTIDVVAPGQAIYSTLPQNQFGFMTGTSQATAIVTRSALQVLVDRKNLITVSEWKKALKESVGVSDKALKKKTKWGVWIGG